MDPTAFVSMNRRTPLPAPREETLVGSKGRPRAKWAALFSIHLTLKQKRDRYVGVMDRAEPSTVRAKRGPGAKAWATPWSFFFAACGSATAFVTGEAPVTAPDANALEASQF